MSKLPELSIPEIKQGVFKAGRQAGMTLIAGPCVIESEEHCVKIAGFVKQLCEQLNINYIFKASFDKANRSSIESYRGPGPDKGLEILGRVKEKCGVKVLTDIHEPGQASPAGQVVDVIQIPAFLARQTDLLIAAAKTGKPVNVKKAQFMAGWDMSNVLDKLKSGGAGEIVFTDRGVCFGYNRWVMDMRNIEWMHQFGVPVLADATHAAADPGGAGKSSSGQREMGPLLARCGIAGGADGLFLEVHDNPEKALSDAATVLPLEWLENLLTQCVEIFECIRR